MDDRQLRWLSTRRGMKELDMLLGAYLEHCYPYVSAEEQSAFVALLHYQDPHILDLLFGRLEDENPQRQRLVLFLRNYAQDKALFRV
ncbi:MAG: succinate dehydrogenase assembly factor 2 [Cardiobacteriaceae bacterium]|nr:succinate dehydrogenase assembly factor 2 [Cardiobacteriaceae bacterium]